MQTLTKQPNDELDYDVDFSAWLPDGDTVTAATAVSDKPAELIVTKTQFTSQCVKVWIKGGLDRAVYKITVTAATAGGRVKETEFRLRIKEQ